jgi:twinkle protein
MDKWVEGTPQDLPKRGLTEETCRKWGYFVGESAAGERVQIANYRNEAGVLVAQKLRTKDKKFSVIGAGKDMPLYGRHLWRDKGRMIVITEGEIDALTVSQLQGNKWPVVSLPNGCASAVKTLKASLEYLEHFETVVLLFDNDEPGQKAAAACAPLFSPGRCKVARIDGYKDANDALLAGHGSRVIDAIWGAKEYRPDGVVAAGDLASAVLADMPNGTPWFLEEMTKWTYGRRPGEIYAFGAGTGVGKTDLFTQSIAYDLTVLKKKVGVVYLEQPPVETLRRIAGKVAGKVFHVPGYEQADLVDAMHRLDGAGLYMYDHFGASDWETIKARIRFMVVGLGCEHIYLDHLTALVAQEEDEKKSLDSIMSQLAGQAQELKHTLHFISHLATPEGRPHEEGGRVMIRHFRGSRSIGFWSHFMFGLERNQQAEDEAERSTTTLRCLKDRVTGSGTGHTLAIRYDRASGLLVPVDAPFEPDAGDPQGDF